MVGALNNGRRLAMLQSEIRNHMFVLEFWNRSVYEIYADDFRNSSVRLATGEYHQGLGEHDEETAVEL